MRMALKLSMDFRGIPVSGAYIKVINPTIHEGNTSMSFTVNYSVDSGAVTFNSVYLQTGYSLEGENPIKQAYLQLKGMEEFAGAEDC